MPFTIHDLLGLTGRPLTRNLKYLAKVVSLGYHSLKLYKTTEELVIKKSPIDLSYIPETKHLVRVGTRYKS